MNECKPLNDGRTTRLSHIKHRAEIQSLALHDPLGADRDPHSGDVKLASVDSYGRGFGLSDGARYGIVRILSPRFLSSLPSYDAASSIWRALGAGWCRRCRARWRMATGGRRRLRQPTRWRGLAILP